MTGRLTILFSFSVAALQAGAGAAAPPLAAGALRTRPAPAPAAALPAVVAVPAGFEVEVFASGLSYVTGLAFDGDGILYASEANVLNATGRVLRVEDRDGNGVAETIEEFAGGLGQVTGIAFRSPFSPADPRLPRSARSMAELERIRRGHHQGHQLDLYASHFIPGPGGGGTISRLRDLDGDGVAELVEDIVTDLPSDGINGNQQVAIGPDGRIFFGQGGRTNAGVPLGGPPDTPQSGTILRVSADGQGLEVHASGLRNVFDLLFTPAGELLASENGPDASGPNPILDAPDELNAILAGAHYGWPDHFGFPPANTGTLGPIAQFASASSTDGIALSTADPWCGFEGDVFAAQFGSFSSPTVGRKVMRIRFVGARGILVDDFATGFERPLDVAFGPDDRLYVADFSNVFFSPQSAVIYRIQPSDLDGNGVPDICQ